MFIPSLQRVFTVRESQHSLTLEKENIKAAYASGLFAPFRQDFDISEEYPYVSYWEELKKLVGGASLSKLDPSRIAHLSLFARLLRSDLDTFDKKVEIENYLSSLSENAREHFFDSLSKQVPSCIAIWVLQYAPIEIHREICRSTLKERNGYKMPCKWMREVIDNKGLYPHAGDFLDKFFQSYPLCEQKELVFYFFLRNNVREQMDFLSALNKPLRIEIESFFEELHTFLAKALEGSLFEERVFIPFEGNQRKYFLHLFITHELNSSKAIVLVFCFHEEDWQFVQAHVQARHMADLTLFWITQAVTFLLEKKEQKINDLKEASTWLFFSNAFKNLPRALNDQQHQDLQKSINALSPPLIAKYYTPLNHPLFFRALTPRKIMDLLSFYSLHKKISVHESTVEWVIADIWNSLELLHGFSFAFETCFNFEKTAGFENILFDFNLDEIPVIELTVYSSLSRSEQLRIINFLVSDREMGVRKLFDWCYHCLLENLEKRLLPGVKPCIFRELNQMLLEVDKTLPGTLRDILQRLKIEKSALDLLFPIIEETREGRQQRAFEQLKEFLLNKEINYLELRGFINALYQDLHADMERSTWISRLFEQTPKQFWPALFFYFENDLNKNAAGINCADWLPNKEKWIELATDTVLETSSYQLLVYPDNRVLHWGLKNLSLLLTKTKSMERVIKQLCQKAPAEKWIPILDTLRQVYHRDRNSFYNLVARCMQEMEMNKMDFIAERFIAFDQAKRNCAVGGYIELEDALFDTPFIRNNNEKIKLFSYLINKINVDFLAYFLTHPRVASKMIGAIQLQPNQGKDVLWKWIDALINTKNSSDIKTAIFQRMASGYTPQEFIALFEEPEFHGFSAHIQTWYQVDIEKLAKRIDSFSIASWSLLQFFHREAVYPTLFCKIKYLQRKNNWIHIFICLEQLCQVLNKEQLIFTLLNEEELESFRRGYQTLISEKSLAVMLTGNIGEVEATLALKLTNNWTAHVDAWALKKFKQEYESHFSCGGLEKSSYNMIIDVYNGLDRAGVLMLWQQKFLKILPKEYQKEFLAANQAYRDTKQERDFERKEE